MAIFSYAGDVNVSAYSLLSSGAQKNISPFVTIAAQDFQSVQASGSSTIFPSSATVVLADQGNISIDTAIYQLDSYQATLTPKSTQFIVGEDKSILKKVPYYRGNIGGQYVFSKVTPPPGATDVIHLGLVPADL